MHKHRKMAYIRSSSSLQSHLLLLLPSLFLAITLLVHPTSAQNVAPQPVTGPAFARYGTRLYISGGRLTSNDTTIATYPQFYAMDLSVSWNAASPVWEHLQSGPEQSTFTAAMSKDGQDMVTFHSGPLSFAWRYNVQGDHWSYSKVTVPNVNRQGVAAVTDPTTGLVYLAGGFGLGNDMTKMVIYDFATDSLSEKPMPAERAWQSTMYYQAVWWPTAKTILYFGGQVYFGVQDSTEIMQYTPGINSWAPLTVRNPASRPSKRNDFCMAMSEDGKKLVVFGGRLLAGGLSGEIFVLNLETLMWTAGPNLTSPRIYPACTIVGSTFISWGGQDQLNTASKAAVLFNIDTLQYITRYEPPPVFPSPSGTGGTNSSSTATPDDDGGSKPSGAVIGGAVGGAVAILAAGAIALFAWRKKKGHGPSNKSNGEEDEDRVTLTPLNQNLNKRYSDQSDNSDATPSPPLPAGSSSTGHGYGYQQQQQQQQQQQHQHQQQHHPFQSFQQQQYPTQETSFGAPLPSMGEDHYFKPSNTSNRPGPQFVPPGGIAGFENGGAPSPRNPQAVVYSPISSSLPSRTVPAQGQSYQL